MGIDNEANFDKSTEIGQTKLESSLLNRLTELRKKTHTQKLERKKKTN